MWSEYVAGGLQPAGSRSSDGLKPVGYVLLATFLLLLPVHARQPRPVPPIFPPEQLGLLEGADRDDWQQPERVMDHLLIFEGAHVADIGAGGGWFTVRLARRVGPRGIVYAEDIQRPMIETIGRRMKREGLTQVKTVLGTPTDPHLQPGLDAVLMVGVYTQIRDPIGLLRHIAQALGPKGQLGIVDYKPDGSGGPGPPIEERMNPDVVKTQVEAAGLTLRSHETFLRYQYLLVFGKSEVKGQKSEVKNGRRSK
jgi:ubiquinone/menaquinone biosynthesis C-methylase UbiE